MQHTFSPQKNHTFQGSIATIDIGSNSVRLVVYEKLARALTPIFNEKVLCGLARHIATTNRLSDEDIERALKALSRFRVLCTILHVEKIFVLATAASRDAENGPEFLKRAEAACGQPIDLISGAREAQLSAYAIASGLYEPDGVVGDLGGGSLEFTDVSGQTIGEGISLRLGGLALQDASNGSIKKAEKIVKTAFADLSHLDRLKGRTFYAVGGTWRALAKLYMSHKAYPLHVMHGYATPASDMLEYVRMVERVDADTLEDIGQVSEARRSLLAYGALLMEEIIRRGKPKNIVVSALGVREGLLYEQLDTRTRSDDPLIAAASELNVLRSRSPQHGEDLIRWTDQLITSVESDETLSERRLRHAACLLADIGWRAHPDYRGEQSLNVITHAAFIGIDHPGRIFLALSVFFRHMGVSVDAVSPRIRELISPRLLERARVLGAAMRVAFLISAAMPDVLEKAPLRCIDEQLVLTLGEDIAALKSERLFNRLKQLGKLVGLKTSIETQGTASLPAA